MVSQAARAEEAPPVGVAIAVGVATALVPLAVGSMIVAGAETDRSRNGGLLLAMNGLALAPVMTHLIEGERGRGLVFGAVPFAAMVAMAALMLDRPQVINDLGFPSVRLPFGAILIVAVLASGGGIADGFLAGERWRKRVNVMPVALPGGGGIVIGGSL